jgi:tetratricopeptide (TPR) repeat protein
LAGELSLEHLAKYPEDLDGVVLAAEAAILIGDHAAAVEYFLQLPRDGGQYEFLREAGLGERADVAKRLSDAERHYQRALAINPGAIEVADRLGHIWQLAGRNLDAAPLYHQLLRLGKCRGDELVCAAGVERFFRRDDRFSMSPLESGTDDPLLILGEARRQLFENHVDVAERLLRETLAARPDLGEAQGRLGRIIVDRGDHEAFLRWRSTLSHEVLNHPEVWLVHGLEARAVGQLEGAARCFLEALWQAPQHLAANVQLAGVLERLGQREAAERFTRRAEELSEVETIFNQARNSAEHPVLVSAAEAMGRTGRFWEAAGWYYVLSQLDPGHAEYRTRGRAWRRRALEDADSRAFRLAEQLFRREDFALPRWNPLAPASPGPTPSGPATTDRPIAWEFVDVATEAGAEFRYFEGTGEANRLEHIFNTMGSGLGVLDYDLDGWPDFHLAQAHDWRGADPPWKNPAATTEWWDQLYRNRRGRALENITPQSRLREIGFSHGVAVGDPNQDGFPDLYIGNLGRNRLYLNQGDGTFIDATDEAGVAGDEWSTSAVWADLNGDVWPDLYVLNYSLKDATAEKRCFRDGTRAEVACTPTELTAETDRLYLNLGDGRFEDVSVASGITAAAGKGLGVIAWDFAGTGQLGLFVANDTMPNFLWLPTKPDAAGIPRFQEEGVVRGLAFDADGNAQASMGVAASDANGDGRIDLFITNFFGESNTFYEQQPDGFFRDMTRPMGLRDAGFWMLGFGCQFADWDGDGWDDLVATNGHVDQLNSKGTSDRMPPQLYRNLEGRRFEHVPQADLGPFFQGRYLGRGLAICDWNRDHRPDFAAAQVHGPWALVENRTVRDENTVPLVVRLVGTQGPRDPVGARVTARSGDWTVTRLVTSGDGFLVTNERRWQWAVPRALPVVTLEVRWPRGTLERFVGVAVGGEVVLIEGRGVAVSLPE